MIAGNFNLRWRAGAGAWQSRAFACRPPDNGRTALLFLGAGGTGLSRCSMSSAIRTVVYTNTVACSAMARTTLTLPAGVNARPLRSARHHRRFAEPLRDSLSRRHRLADQRLSQFNLLIIGRDALTNDPMRRGRARCTFASRWKDFARAAAGSWCSSKPIIPRGCRRNCSCRTSTPASRSPTRSPGRAGPHRRRPALVGRRPPGRGEDDSLPGRDNVPRARQRRLPQGWNPPRRRKCRSAPGASSARNGC